MHDDERRDPELAKKMILDEFVSDPEELHRRYQGLVERDRRARQTKEIADNRVKELAGKVRSLERRVEEVEGQRKTLSRRLVEAGGSLDAYRRETRRLKDDLQRVRGSRSMRIGRTITGAASIFRGRPSAPTLEEGSDEMPTDGSTPTTEEADTGEASSSRVLPVQDAKDQGASQPSMARQPWQLTFDELEDELEVNPSHTVLHAFLNRVWFQRGDIARCEVLIAEHPELVAKLSPNGQELVGRVHGEARLRDGRIQVPSRAHGAAYRAETDRVMYCVHSTPIFDSNGYSTRTRGLVDGLRENDVDVSVVSRIGYPWDMHADDAPRTQERSVIELGGADYTHLPGADLNRDPLDEYVLKAADAYTREARLRRPARIQAASNFRHALPALIAARRLGIPFVYEVRGLWELTEAVSRDGWEDSERFGLQVRFETLVASEADQVLAITSQVRDELITRGVPGENISLAPNAVNEREFVPLPRDKAYATSIGVSGDRPVIGFAGSLVAYEGLDLLLRAVRTIRDRDVEAQVVIAGSGAAAKDLEKLTDDLGLHDDVTFLGRVPAHDIPKLMSIMDVMPCPRLSTRVTEMVSPLKPLEALSAGKTVILSDVTPQADLLPPGSGRGFLVPAGDVDALADQLEEVLVDEDRARVASRSGRRWITENRTWDVVAQDIRGSYCRATAVARRALESVPRRPLDAIRIGLVADEFTTTTLAARVQVVAIPRDDPAKVITDELDAVVIESAWEGNSGEWHHGVGYYDDKQFSALRRVLWLAGQKGIPTIFWNKEDPVHVRRFLRAAVRCQHVFTTDANLLGRYLSSGSAVVRTASALPFWADLSIHNPVQRPASLAEPSVMYAGTYYGERYKERSVQLATLLKSAEPHGLTIFDRQHDDPDSPYSFPAQFSRYVAGALTYEKILEAYRSHFANLNVNSVADSPTMFSRRVVEVAASGGVVLSGPARALRETFGEAIPASHDPSFHRAYLRQWAKEPMTRLSEAWFQLRSTARSHTSETALAIMFRTAGIPVDGMHDPDYVALLPDGEPETLESVLSQSVRPSALAVPGEAVARVAELAAPLPVVPLAESGSAGAGIAITFDRIPARSMAEDLLTALRFRGDARITAWESTPEIDARLLAVPAEDLSEIPSPGPRLAELEVLDAATASLEGVETTRALALLLPPVRERTELPAELGSEFSEDGTPKTILFAGHDLKFIAPYIDHLRAQGHEVLVDLWQGHSGHDEDASLEMLSRADVVWCEWGLGNAVWYSRKVSAEQRLVVRVHLQEIDLHYLRRIELDAVDRFIFVGELIRRAGIESHGLPEDRCVVIPNFVRAAELDRPKSEEARYTLGLVGIVPKRKRMDLAVDLVEQLHEQDSRYRLRIKGRRPEEFWWMERRPEEMAFYNEQYRRIEDINAKAGAEVIVLDPHGDDMLEWYQSIGIVISTSDFESFHLTLADGAASGSDAVSLEWVGSDFIYPPSMLFPDVDSMAVAILDDSKRAQRADDLATLVYRFDAPQVFASFSELLLEDSPR